MDVQDTPIDVQVRIPMQTTVELLEQCCALCVHSVLTASTPHRARGDPYVLQSYARSKDACRSYISADAGCGFSSPVLSLERTPLTKWRFESAGGAFNRYYIRMQASPPRGGMGAHRPPL